MTVVVVTAVIFLLLCPASVHGQGGVPLWTNRYPSGDARAIAVDRCGNVLVTGHSLNADTNYDYATIKYSNTGVPLWTNRYNGPGNGDDFANAIAVDGAGNVFVTGESGGGPPDYQPPDYATIKYSSLGVPLWTNRYDGPGNRWDSANAIAVDSSGNVFVTGSSQNGSDSLADDYATIAYSSAGVPLWTNRYDGANGLDRAHAIAVDASGNVFVTGESQNDATGNCPLDGDCIDFATVAYSNAGVPLWTNRYDGPANLVDWAKAIAVDTSGDVFVTGRSWANSNPINSDYVTVAYSNSGEPFWANRYDGASTSYEAPTAIALDRSGNVFVTGGSDADWATIKYSNAGQALWTRRFNSGPGGGGPSSIAVDSSGNVFVTGGASDVGATVAYSNSGVLLWTKRFGNAAIGYTTFEKVAVDGSGNVFVTGRSYGAYVTIKYSSSIPLPRLDFQKVNNQLVLSWTNAGFNLQSAPFTSGTFTNIPNATNPYTNSFTSPQQFFRLAQ